MSNIRSVPTSVREVLTGRILATGQIDAELLAFRVKTRVSKRNGSVSSPNSNLGSEVSKANVSGLVALVRVADDLARSVQLHQEPPCLSCTVLAV